MIRLYAIAALSAAVVAAGWWGQAQRDRARAAEAALAGATARLQQVAEANAVHRAHLDRQARERAAYEALADEFDRMEGGDAPLSDYLRAVDERLQ
jgi:biopolymer transport protein ExbB/TolQ